MVTVWCIVVSLGSLFFFGLPLAAWVARRDEEGETETAWLLAPFLGLSIIVLVLQNLVYLDLRVATTTPWLWGAGALLVLLLILSGRWPQLRKAFPRDVFLCALLVCGVQSAGLLIRGVDQYVGRLWIDQFTYTVTAQFLLDQPFSLTSEQVGDQPHLYKALHIKHDRIGQSIHHAFVAASCGLDAKRTFEPAILSACFLNVLALFLLARRVTTRRMAALLAAVGGGLLPAIAQVHLESFHSQMLAMPLMFAWPELLHRLLHTRRLVWLLPTAAVGAAMASIYTDYVPLFVGVAAVVLAIELIKQRTYVVTRCGLCVAVLGLAAVLNIGYVTDLTRIVFGRLTQAGVLPAIYPWALRGEGLARLWVGDFVEAWTAGTPRWLAAGALVLTVGLVAGILFDIWRRRDPVLVGATALLMLPALLATRGQVYAYQFYKILLSVCPLLPLGLAAWHGAIEARTTRWGTATGRLLRGVGLGLAVIVGAATTVMTVRAGVGETVADIGRGFAEHLRYPDIRYLCDYLSRLKGEDVFIHNGPAVVNGWLAYFAREDRVWLGYPEISDISIANSPGGNVTCANLPANLNVIDSGAQYACGLLSSGPFFPDTRTELKARVDPFCIWELRRPDWLMLLECRWGYGPGEIGSHGFWCGDKPIVIHFLSPSAGEARIALRLDAGPNLPDPTRCRLRITTNRGYDATVPVSLPASIELPLRLERGKTLVTITVDDAPRPGPAAPEDPRTLMAAVLEMPRFVSWTPDAP
jgi:hypothetical protein